MAMSKPNRSTHALSKHKGNLKPIQHKISLANPSTVKVKKGKFGLEAALGPSNKLKKDMVYCPMPAFEREHNQVHSATLQTASSRK